MNTVNWLSPGDPKQRTGGYLYNARIGRALRDLGVRAHVHVLDDDWPAARNSHADRLNRIPDGAVVIADGLLWPGISDEEREGLARRTRVWVLMHSLLDKEGDAALAALEIHALRQAHGCIATSTRTARLLAKRLGVSSVSVVIPGTESVHRTQRPGINRLLAVGHVIPRKGYERLFRSLNGLLDVDWTLDIVGSLQRNATHASRMQKHCEAMGLSDRVRWLGELGHDELDRVYAGADILVHAAHFEAYGMVLTEALMRGLPVVSTPAGALDELNSAAVMVVEPEAFAGAVSMWLTDRSAQAKAADAAQSIRFPTWEEQAQQLMGVLELEVHGFSREWLEMREPYDHAARDAALVAGFADAVGDGPARIIELGAGLGSGARFVANHSPKSWSWTLVDRDPALLRAASQRLSCETVQVDLHALDELPTDASGVTLQAVLDLVSGSWLDAFAAWLTQQRLPLLAALTVDGRVDWMPPHEHDAEVQAAFRHHQTWDRGFGPSVGVAAAAYLAEILLSSGYSVQLSEADWEIPAHDAAMVSALVDGTAHAALEAAASAGVDPVAVEAWRHARAGQVGDLAVTVGHLDLLAVPNT